MDDIFTTTVCYYKLSQNNLLAQNFYFEKVYNVISNEVDENQNIPV